MLSSFLSLKRDVEELKRIIANLIRVGTIAEGDPSRGYRVDFGPDVGGQSHLSPWMPHPESGGEAKTFLPLSKGQIVGVLSPVGDARQGFLIRAGFKGGEDASGNGLDETRFLFGEVDVTITRKGMFLKIGEAACAFTAQGLHLTQGEITHNGKNIGDTHTHTHVKAGSDLSGEPVA